MAASPLQTEPAHASRASWIGYVAPMAVFLIVTQLETSLPSSLYVWVYIAKALIVTATLIAFRATWKDIRFEPRVLLPALTVGIFVFIEWIVVDRVTPHLAFMGKRVGFNPFLAISDPIQRGLFLAVRFYGLALMVPVMEELFWRSFLIRYITDQDYESLPIGTFSWAAFAAVAALFGLAHPEWLAAVVCAVAYGLLLWRTRSLFACIVAHAVTNFALGLYVLTTHHWNFW